MKRKPKKSKGSHQRLFPVEGLIEHFRERETKVLPGRYVLTVDDQGVLRAKRRTEVGGVPIPPDLALVCWREAQSEAMHVEHVLTIEAGFWSNDEDFSLPIKHAHVRFFEDTICDALETGFRLALLRYAEDLKNVPEAAALLEQKRKAAKKGGESRRKKAEPNHKAIRKRFRELRKTIPKKTARYLRVAEEYGMSDRHVARIVDGID